MFSPGGYGVGSGPSEVTVSWSTKNPELDTWLAEHLDEAQLGLLGQFDLPTRTRTVMIVREKHRQGTVRVPAQYLLKILCSDGRGGPYTPGPNPSAGPVMHGPPLQPGAPYSPMPPSAGTRRVATPMQGPSSSPSGLAAAPLILSWVRGAWAVHQNRSELLRYLHRHLPSNAMRPLMSLSSTQQYVACVVLLINKEMHSNPEAFFNDFARRVQELPTCMPAAAPAGAPASGSGLEKVALVHLGLSTGLEWHAALLALEVVGTAGIRVEVVDRLACTMEGSSPMEFLQHAQKQDQSKKPVEYVDVRSLAGRFAELAPAWQMSDVGVLVVLVLPATEPSSRMDMVGPGFHTPELADVFHYMNAIKNISGRLRRLSLCVVTPVNMPEADCNFLNEIIGNAIPFSSQELRIPQEQWCGRFHPPGARPPQVVRQVEAFDESTALHPDLRAAWQADSQYSAVLPSIKQLELYFDSVSDNLEVSQQLAEKIERLHCNPAGQADGRSVLLPRKALAHVFGIPWSPWFQWWDEAAPCVKHINRCSGLPCQEADLEATVCGMTRYCSHCCNFYEACVDTPNLWILREAYAIGILRAVKQHANVVPLDVGAKLPSHTCEGVCFH